MNDFFSQFGIGGTAASVAASLQNVPASSATVSASVSVSSSGSLEPSPPRHLVVYFHDGRVEAMSRYQNDEEIVTPGPDKTVEIDVYKYKRKVSKPIPTYWQTKDAFVVNSLASNNELSNKLWERSASWGWVSEKPMHRFMEKHVPMQDVVLAPTQTQAEPKDVST